MPAPYHVALLLAAAVSLLAGSPHVYVLVSIVVVGTAFRARGRTWADRITLFRGLLILGACTWTTQPRLLLPASVLFLLLDGLDGWVARRTRTQSEDGARLDVAVDTVGVLGLACTLVAVHAASPWLLVAGLLRPVFVLLRARFGAAPQARRRAARVFYGLNLLLLGATPWLDAPWTQIAALWVGLSSIYSFSPDFLSLGKGSSRLHYLGAPLALNFLLFAPETYFATANTPSFPWEVVRASGRPPHGLLEFLGAALFDRGGIDPLRILLEFWILWLALGWLARRKPRALGWASNLVALAYLFFWVLIIYRDIIRHIIGRPIDFVHDADYLIHAYRFLRFTLGTTGAVALLAGAAAVLVMVLVLARRALYISAKEIGPLPASFLLGFTLFAVIGIFGPKPGAKYVVQTATGEVYKGVRRARQTYAFRKRDEIVIPKWRASQKLVQLKERPNVVLYIIESYGTLLFSSDSYRGPFVEALEDLARELGPDFYVRSLRSRSPVCGGGSWMSTATMMTGLEIADQVRFDLIAEDERQDWAHTPTLVQTFNRSGYYTFAIQPGNRLDPFNFFGVQVQIDQKDIDYDGPRYIWNAPPDHYSLQYAHQNYVRDTPKPWFVLYENIMSHYPFHTPTGDDNGRARPGERGGSYNESFRGGDGRDDDWLANDRLGDLEVRYLRSIRYSWYGVVDYAKILHGEPLLIVVIGDHPPPHIDSCARNDNTVPLHFITNRAPLLDSLPPGAASLVLPAEEEPGVGHADLKGLIEGMLQGPEPTSQGESGPE